MSSLSSSRVSLPTVQQIVGKKGCLIVIRHGESVSVAKNSFGISPGDHDDDALTPKGIQRSEELAQELRMRGYCFNAVHSSPQLRAQQTGKVLLGRLGQSGLDTQYSEALGERRFGILQGLNKDEARKRWGHEQVNIWHLSYEVGALPGS